MLFCLFCVRYLSIKLFFITVFISGPSIRASFFTSKVFFIVCYHSKKELLLEFLSHVLQTVRPPAPKYLSFPKMWRFFWLSIYFLCRVFHLSSPSLLKCIQFFLIFSEFSLQSSLSFFIFSVFKWKLLVICTLVKKELLHSIFFCVFFLSRLQLFCLPVWVHPSYRGVCSIETFGFSCCSAL